MGAAQVLKGITAFGVATLVGEFIYAHQRNLPEFPDHECNAMFGADDLPAVSVLAVGDSALTGPGLASPDQIFLHRVLNDLASEYHITLTSLAKGGSRTLDVIETQLPLAIAKSWDVVVLSCGVNDVMHGVPIRLVERRLREIVDELERVATRVVLAGVGDVGTAPRAPFPLSLGVTGLARATDRLHAKVMMDRPLVLKAPMWETTTETFRSGADLFAEDLFHPNAAGHEVWASAVRDTMRQAVTEAVAQRRQGEH